MQTGDPANALREYVRAAELLPEDKAAQLKAANFIVAGRPISGCAGPGKRMLARTPGNVEAQVLLRQSLAGLKDFDGAKARLREGH